MSATADSLTKVTINSNSHKTLIDSTSEFGEEDSDVQKTGGRESTSGGSEEEDLPQPKPATRKRRSRRVSGQETKAEDGDADSIEKHITRSSGNIYISSERWLKYGKQLLRNCYLYVSVVYTEAQRQDRDTTQAENEAQIKVPDRRSVPVMSHGHIHGRLKRSIPDRVRINNEILCMEMARLTGIENLNHDQVAPFRSLIPFEKEFKTRLEDQEIIYGKMVAALDKDGKEPNIKKGVLTKYSYDCMFFPSKYHGISNLQASELEEARMLRDGLRSLVHFLDNDVKDLVDTYRQVKEGTLKEIAFTHLWYLFQPGDQIISTKPKEQVYRVMQVCGGRKHLVDKDDKPFSVVGRTKVSNLVIDCFYLDFDGKQFRPVPKEIVISPYQDLRAVTSLEAYPLKFGGEEKAKELVERGKKFVRLAQVAHKKYAGLSLKEGDSYSNYEELESDVIIDFDLAFRNSRVELPPFESGVIVEPTMEDPRESHENGVYHDDSTALKVLRSDFVNNTTLLDPHPIGRLGKDRWILLPYRVYGYVLLSRRWYPLNIDLVQDIETVKDGDLDGFNDLVLPPGHKDIVRALVNTHARGPAIASHGDMAGEEREFDLVKGKGKGLIILLHGAPGVGKTSTAECVAANTGRPLFPITCGDIGGTSAQEVERNLEGFFDLARKWGCVLLLDEADVFLSERTKGDIRQNSLVSVFLRVLEYYSGILILTTNRIGEFDEAVKSRVHCALYYPPLDKNNTIKVWKMNLERLARRNQPGAKRPVDFDRKEILRFARDHWSAGNRWNGRQIKNAFQTAIALADWDHLKGGAGLKDGTTNPLLESRHFETVSAASAHFDRYLSQVRQSDQTRAKTNELRRDDFIDQGKADATSVKLKSLEISRGSAVQQRIPWPEDPYDEDLPETEDSSAESDDTDEEFQKEKNRRLEERRRKERKEKEEKLRMQQEKKLRKEQRELAKREKAENERRIEKMMREKASKQESPSASDSDSY